MQIYIETNKINRLWPQEFSRWETGEGAERIGIDAFGFLNELVDELSHRARAAPAHHISRDLVGDAKGKHRRVAAARVNSAPNAFHCFGPVLRRLEEAQMFVPGNIDQQIQLMLGRQIHEPSRRRRIDPDQVRSKSFDLRKIGRGLFRRSEWLSGGIRRERPISNAFDVEFPAACREKLAI